MRLEIHGLLRKIRFEYKITFNYLIFGILWILFSDKILELIVTDNNLLTEFQSFKGSFFIIITSFFLYLLVKSHMNTIRLAETHRQLAEEALRKSEKNFRTIFNESPIGIELYRSDGILVNTNSASLNMYGIPNISDVIGFNLFDSISLDDINKEKLRKGQPVAYQSLFDFEKVKEVRQYTTNRTGKTYFGYIITPLLKPEGKSIDGFLVQVQDISERKRAEEEIIMLAHSLRSVNECVSITDTKNKILFVNESFLKTYGYSEDELIGKNIDFVSSTANPHGLTSEILTSTLKGSWKGELINKRKDGSEFPVYLSTNIVRDKSGIPIALIGVASDILEFKRNEEELIQAKERAEQSDRLKSAFLANMSHEIRTPMNGILGFAELLRMPGLTGDQQQEYIGIIKKSGDRMLNIINDIVDISKIEAGLIEVVNNESNINEQTEFVYNFFKPQADEKGLKLICKNGLPTNEAIVITDKEKIYAIITNLVKNAIKYTDIGAIEFGYNIVEGERATPLPASLLEFYVKDTGIGVPEERQQAIFDRFIQADIADTRAYQGAGLGLSISKAYVTMLGGKLWVESIEGKGSTFYFTIPYIPVQKVKEDTSTFSLPQGVTDRSKKLNVLIVEDDEISVMLLMVMLKAFSGKTLIADTGAEAIEICRNNPDIDLVLMDIKMPVMDGYEATRQIRQFNNDVTIIAQTAYGLSGDEEKALVAGCSDYIAKPLDIAILKRMIQKYFK